MTTAEDRYQHRYHAGNVGDVWKHAVLAELVALLQLRHPAIQVIETHAGAGRYPLGETGEWTAGIGRLWGRSADTSAPRASTPGGLSTEARRDPAASEVNSSPAANALLSRWLGLLAAAGASAQAPRIYPGSPLQLAAMLRPSDSADFFELDGQAAAALRACLPHDRRLCVHHGDGLEGALTLLSSGPGGTTSAAPARGGLSRDGRRSVAGQAAPAAAARAPGARLLVIDPPFGTKEEWRTIPAAMAAAAQAAPGLCQLLWYPIKSLTRPNALLLALRALGRPLLALDLLTTPLELQRNRLNGSGVALLAAPDGLAERAAGLAPLIGAACATHGGHWSLRLQAWDD